MNYNSNDFTIRLKTLHIFRNIFSSIPELLFFVLVFCICYIWFINFFIFSLCKFSLFVIFQDSRSVNKQSILMKFINVQ